ncbi:MAG TPA: lysylphosphatidylglycerol synthase transmembrane domain-containing protein [Terriglobales bacterium]|nr:lysylphosphatidylglycerol synthase transmembrane domain-containing protein [Terriglobales bacterium]
MKKRQTTIYLIIAAVLAALIYLQFRTWRDFDWSTFWNQTDHVNLFHILHGVLLIYLGYLMRALRWKIFLRPVRPQASTLRLVAPTIIGFTGLALLGRPGELIRPYLIARKEEQTFSSQLAVWAVERIFDIGAFTGILVGYIFLASGPKELDYYAKFRQGGLILVALVLGLAVGAWMVSKKGEAIADWVERRFAHHASNFGHRIALRVREFRGGLNTIHGPWELFQLIVVSVLMWYFIALAYKEVTHSYGVESLDIQLSQVLLLMGSSMVGSMIQLPGVGGGSQLATISTLKHVFDVPNELAASCGIMLWLVTFVAVVPLGLVLAHLDRLSFRELVEETQREEEAGVVPSPPGD